MATFLQSLKSIFPQIQSSGDASISIIAVWISAKISRPERSPIYIH